jgi:hypothetical protein
MIRVLQGDCRDVLATLEADSIEACAAAGASMTPFAQMMAEAT